MKPHHSVLFAAGLMASLATCPAATVVADFTLGGGTTSASHQYVGKAGEGWKTAWSSSVMNSATISAEVNGGLLEVTAAKGAAATARTSLRRQYESGGFSENPNALIDTTAAYSISFDLTFNDLTGFSASTDIFGMFENAGIQQGSAVGNNGNSWAFQILGDTRALQWGNGGRNGNVTFSNSGITVTTGVTYSFTLDINPGDRSWIVAITPSDTGIVTTSGALGFRTASGSLGAAGRYVHFNTLANTADASWEYALSGITISQVIPEPSALALLLGVTTAGIAMLRRRRACIGQGISNKAVAEKR